MKLIKSRGVSKTTSKVLKIILALALLSVLLLIGGIVQDSFKTNHGKISGTESIAPSLTLTPTPTYDWKTYENNDFNISFNYPRLLLPQESINNHYDFFILFTENAYAKQMQMKGMALGITKRSVEEELKLVKDSLLTEGLAKLESEGELESLEGVFLHFVPNSQEGEPRDVFIIKGKDYVYSLSTHPSQKDKLIQSIKLLNANDPENPTTLFCGGIRGIACPHGFTCRYDGNYPDSGGVCVEEK